MEIVVNPKYRHLYNEIKDIPALFENIKHIIQNNRNDVRLHQIGDHKVVIKSFKGMYFTNQIAYSLFRKSKAKRSYEISFRLLSKGFIAPEPIAFVDCYKLGFLTQSYFISAYYKNTSFNEMLDCSDNKNNLLSSFVSFTNDLHRAGVLHTDYSNGNILCNESNGSITFGVVDLNRVKFRRVSFDAGLKNFSTLSVGDEDLAAMITQYAGLRGLPAGDALTRILNLRKRRWASYRWRNKVKSILFPWRIRRETIAG